MCVIVSLNVSVGIQDYNSNFVKNNKNMIVNILLYDVGRVMGLNRTSEENDLMCFTEFTNWLWLKKIFYIERSKKNCTLNKNYHSKNQKLSFELNYWVKKLHVKN